MSGITHSFLLGHTQFLELKCVALPVLHRLLSPTNNSLSGHGNTPVVFAPGGYIDMSRR